MLLSEKYFSLIGFKEEEVKRSVLLYKIAKKLSSRDMVLKGGNSIVIGYGLNRWSRGLDFDSDKETRYKDDFLKAFKDQELKYKEINEEKIGSRIVTTILYDKNKNIKLDTEYDSEYIKKERNIVKKSGVYMYGLKVISQMKYEMVLKDKRARDLFDTAFLIRHYPGYYGNRALQGIKRRIEGLGMAEIRKLFKDDETVKNFDANAIMRKALDDINKLLTRYERKRSNNKSKSF